MAKPIPCTDRFTECQLAINTLIEATQALTTAACHPHPPDLEPLRAAQQAARVGCLQVYSDVIAEVQKLRRAAFYRPDQG